MSSLVNKSPSATYKSLLKITDESNGITTTNTNVEDGQGTSTPLILSSRVVHIQASNDTTGTFTIKKSNGDTLFIADTTNSCIKAGTQSTYVNTQLLTFSAYRLVPSSAGDHMFITCGGNGFNASIAEINGGTGTDPSTSLDKANNTDETVNMLFNVPYNMTIDAVKVFASTDQDTDCTLNYHLMSYDMVADGTTNDGNLSNGVVLADGQATAVDRNVIKTTDLTIQSSSVTSGKIIACFVENETNTDDINIQVQVKYHIA